MLVLRRRGPERRHGSSLGFLAVIGAARRRRPRRMRRSCGSFGSRPCSRRWRRTSCIQGISLLLRRDARRASIAPGSRARSRRRSGWCRSRSSSSSSLAVVVELRAALHALRARSCAPSGRTRRARIASARASTSRTCRAYVLCSLFTAAGGLMLASQVAVGDAGLGLNYTLTSITAVVLGGASIFGGRGSFIGALLRRRPDPGDRHVDHVPADRDGVAVLPAGNPDPGRRGRLLAHAQPATVGCSAPSRASHPTDIHRGDQWLTRRSSPSSAPPAHRAADSCARSSPTRTASSRRARSRATRAPTRRKALAALGRRGRGRRHRRRGEPRAARSRAPTARSA